MKPWIIGGILMGVAGVSEAQKPSNREPLKPKAYAELPLGAIKPQGWLRQQLQLMAAGMTGRLDELYPEVCGERNAWLGGDGDAWERGPYWIDGLYPLSLQLEDKPLEAKAMKWIEWTLANQRPNGQIGPYELKDEDRTRPPPPGVQTAPADDWWPRMVMLKILQQYYMATGDARVVDCMTRYFRYQLAELPHRPLFDPEHPEQGGSWWAARRGGENLMSVYWLYNITGEPFLLELGDLIYRQTYPFTDRFLARDTVELECRISGTEGFHCVNLAQGIKTPIVRYQFDGDPRHLEATKDAFEDILKYHGQPHGLYGGDEGLHGVGLTRGSELCTAVEMLFSLEKMLEITGDLDFADRMEMIAFNALPTQVSDDCMTRQYFQQANQIACTFGDRNFHDDDGDRIVFGLTSGFPCCTCNFHQGWPKFIQHLWMASADGGLAALVYGPCEVTTRVAGGKSVSITESTRYPMEDSIAFTIKTEGETAFPLHLRIPGWCEAPSIQLNGQPLEIPKVGNLAVVDRTWRDGDVLVLELPGKFRVERWEAYSASLYRGPLLFALKMTEQWTETPDAFHPDVPIREVRSSDPWNFALVEQHLSNPDAHFKLQRSDHVGDYFWNLESAPLSVVCSGVIDPNWEVYRQSAGPIPWSPKKTPIGGRMQDITLVPYGCTTLRISAFPSVWVNGE